MKSSLIIYSGGMDSTTMLHDFKHDIALAVSFHYGSKHNDIEIYYARQNCIKLKIQHIVIELDFMNRYFKSDLLKSGGAIPDGHYADETMKKTVVPFRNGIMLAIATGIADSHGLKGIYIANHFGDHAIYPDCRPSFITPMSDAMSAGTYQKIKLLSPYCDMTKREIAQKGHAMNIDYSMTYSCYKGKRDFILFGHPFGDIHCGKCGTCVERMEALRGIDPTEYEELERGDHEHFPFQ